MANENSAYYGECSAQRSRLRKALTTQQNALDSGLTTLAHTKTHRRRENAPPRTPTQRMRIMMEYPRTPTQRMRVTECSEMSRTRRGVYHLVRQCHGPRRRRRQRNWLSREPITLSTSNGSLLYKLGKSEGMGGLVARFGKYFVESGKNTKVRHIRIFNMENLSYFGSRQRAGDYELAIKHQL